MNRLEIFANQALSDIIERKLSNIDGLHFSIINSVSGIGNKGPCMDSEVWPESNVIFIIYLSSEKLENVYGVLKNIKDQFPIIGLHAFVTENSKEFI